MIEKKTSKKKIVFDGIFLIVVFGLTLYGIFKGEDLSVILYYIRKTNDYYLILAVICVVFFVYSESIIIHQLLNSLNIKLSMKKCFLISNVGFFFSCITPSASGGQPMQVLYMRKENVPVPVSTIVLMIITIMYKSVLVIVGISVMIFGGGFANRYLGDVLGVFYLGVILNIFCVFGMIIFAFHPTLAKKVGGWIIKMLGNMKILKNADNWNKRLENSMIAYQKAALFFKDNITLMIKVFFITVIQRFALFFVTYFVYRSFGLEEYKVAIVVFLQAAISIAVDMLPLPGGMGISEKLFHIIFMPLFGRHLILPGMVLARGLGYYVQLIMCAIFTGIAHFVLGKERSR